MSRSFPKNTILTGRNVLLLPRPGIRFRSRPATMAGGWTSLRLLTQSSRRLKPEKTVRLSLSTSRRLSSTEAWTGTRPIMPRLIWISSMCTSIKTGKLFSTPTVSPVRLLQGTVRRTAFIPSNSSSATRFFAATTTRLRSATGCRSTAASDSTTLPGAANSEVTSMLPEDPTAV